MSANNYQVIIGEAAYLISGTSASAPVISAFVSIVNAKRLSKGYSTLGWLNPSIYANNGAFCNDVTVGDIRCTKGEGLCCSVGFYASTGWDPATGKFISI